MSDKPKPTATARLNALEERMGYLLEAVRTLTELISTMDADKPKPEPAMHWAVKVGDSEALAPHYTGALAAVRTLVGDLCDHLQDERVPPAPFQFVVSVELRDGELPS